MKALSPGLAGWLAGYLLCTYEDTTKYENGYEDATRMDLAVLDVPDGFIRSWFKVLHNAQVSTA